MIRRARRDGRETRGNEEREWIEKGSHCFFKSSGCSGIKIWFFFKLIERIIKKKICQGVKKYVPLCNKLKSLS